MKINFSNYDQLFKAAGFVFNYRYAPYIFRKKELTDLFKEKMKESTKHKRTEEQEMRIVRDFLRENFDEVDQEAYLFYSLKTIREERLEDECPNAFEACKQYLADSQFVHYEPGLTDDGQDVEIKRVTPSVLIGKKENIDNSKMDERWRSIRAAISPEDLFDIDSSPEMLNFYCKNRSLAIHISRLNCIRIIEKFEKLSVEDKLAFMRGERFEDFDELTRKCYSQLDLKSDEDLRLIFECIPEYMQKFPEGFDLDKMLLIAAFKANECLERHWLSEEQNRKYALILKTCRDCIRSKSKEVFGIKDSYGEEMKFPYSFKTLQEACKRIASNGHYISDKEHDTIVLGIYANPASICYIDPAIIKSLHLSNEDLQYLLNAPGTIGYLLKNNLVSKPTVKGYLDKGQIAQEDIVDLLNQGLITDEEARKYTSQMVSIEDNTFKAFDERGILSCGDKLDLFIEGKIKYEHIDSLGEDEKKQVADMLTVSKLVELYKNRKDEKTSEQYIRYAQIFRNLVLKNKSKDERKNVDEQILVELGDELEDETLEDLYNSHLITFETLKGWSGPKLVSEMMERTEIRPEDIKLMCSNGEFEILYEVLKNPNIPRNTKMSIFRTSFTNIDYETMDEHTKQMLQSAKDKCLQLINFQDKKAYGPKGHNGDGHKDLVEDGKQRKSYTSDPQLRWDLIDLMGSYSYEVLDQGLVIFKFPEYKGGTIVLEKMYRKDKPEYGRATKIISMTPEEFDRIKPELIVNEDIPPFMVDSHPTLQGRVRNLHHSTAWGQQFADYFEYNLEGERTPEEIAKIDKKIQSILNSRELRQ